MVTFYAVVLVLLLPLAPGASAESVAGRVHVVDGDTIDVGGARIRLHGIDAPEIGQPCAADRAPPRDCGAWVAGRLRERVSGRRAACDHLGLDRYGRIIGRCRIEGRDIARDLVRDGLALAYRRYSTAYLPEERAARAAGIGIWDMRLQSPEAWRAARRGPAPRRAAGSRATSRWTVPADAPTCLTMTAAPDIRFLSRETPPHILTLILLSGIAALNMSVFLPSLSGMAGYFGADYAVMQLAVSGYLAMTAVLQILIGPLSDRYGRRPVVLGSLAIFVAATLGALAAPSVEIFLVFRMLQGAVVTGIVLSRAIVRDMVPAEESASMIGYVTMGMALVPMIGPVIGGALDQAFGWHATFGFLALCGAGVLALCWADQGETIAGGGLGFAQQFRAYPELLTSPRFWGYALCAAFASGAFFAFLGGSSFVASDIYGLSPLWTGIALGAPAIGYAVGNGLSGRFSVALGINRMIQLGALAAAAGIGASLVLTLAGLHSPWAFFPFCIMLGLGNGMLLPNATAGLLSVRPHLAGTASGLGGAIMIGGGAVMAAVAGAILSVESGPLPLQSIMVGTTVCSGIAIALVIRRERRLALET